MAKKQFKAESKRLLDLMINSIYTHKEIFLRELISNASDATDKLYYNAMKEGKTGITRDSLPIELTLDKENRKFIIEDHGCGMTAEELENNLGTIAHSGSLAFKKAIESLKPVLLEPIVLLCVSVPDEYMGDVIGDLSSRRGKVLGSDSQVGITEIKAHIPMSEVLRYAPDLRSITGGQGVFTMEFDHYEEAPQPIVDKVIAEHQKAKAEE